MGYFDAALYLSIGFVAGVWYRNRVGPIDMDAWEVTFKIYLNALFDYSLSSLKEAIPARKTTDSKEEKTKKEDPSRQTPGDPKGTDVDVD
jgi:hypothetical protein